MKINLIFTLFFQQNNLSSSDFTQNKPHYFILERIR